ncbi:unnamed protein product [Allacma fusca]|uniref:DUF4806 domain-containing protein n=1 Tax=Allacma fusca TaxID=39272 RepID=A0A8J2K9X1_9HEXA|nr:unnamed protein product [Allacma fusca]
MNEEPQQNLIRFENQSGSQLDFASISAPVDNASEVDGVVLENPDGCHETHSIIITQPDAGFQSKILEYLADVKLKLDRLETKVDLLRSSSEAHAAIDDSGFEDFPFNDHKELVAFKRALDGDKILKLKTVERFSSFGGRKASLHVAAILTDLLTDELATGYSWCGLRGNRSFSELGFLKLIYASVKKTAKNAGTITREDVKSSIDSWLRHAKDRIAGKAKKHMLQRPEENNSSGEDV